MDQVSVSSLAGNPDAISKVPCREDINYLDGCTNSENLQLLNLM
jgi:translation initiation factor eIF-2B subunit delta